VEDLFSLTEDANGAGRDNAAVMILFLGTLHGKQ